MFDFGAKFFSTIRYKNLNFKGTLQKKISLVHYVKAGKKIINRRPHNTRVCFYIYIRYDLCDRVKYNYGADPNLSGSTGFTLNETLLFQFIKIGVLKSLLSRNALNRLVNEHFLNKTCKNTNIILIKRTSTHR